MKLFNKTIDRQLFEQYLLASNLSKQEVVVKIFNPQGAGTWFILNSDPEDPDYLWAIVDLGYGAEIGSVSRSDLETYRGKFGLGLERDLSFEPVNAEELYKGLRNGKYYAKGGDIENFSDNQRMIMNQNVELEHHHEELEDILEDEMPVPAWVVAKMATATQSISDVTHYLDGQKELMEEELEVDDDEDDENEENEDSEFDNSNFDPTIASNLNVVEPINISNGTKSEITKKFTDDAMGNLKGFLKGMEGIDLRDDYTFDYKNEQYEIEPIINSNENGVSNAVFTIFNGDSEEVGEIAYSSDGGKQKFTANSELFSWNNTKFENGGFMNGVYAEGGSVKRTRRTKDQIRKDEYNKEVDLYNWYIINIIEQKAISGFEYKEDALDLLSDYDGDKNYKVVSKRVLKNLGIEIPNENWKYADGGEMNLKNEEGKTIIAVYKEKSFGYIDPSNPKTFNVLSSNLKDGSTQIGNTYQINSPEDYRLANINDFEDYRIYYPQYTQEMYMWSKPQEIHEDGGFMNSVYAKGGEMNLKDLTNKEVYEEVKLKVGNSVWENNALNILRNESLKTPNGKFNPTGDLDLLIKYLPNYSSYAKGGEIAKAEILGLSKNIMGTTDIEMKITGMRKPQNFTVYPIGKDDAANVITIQSDTRIGQINLVKGVGVMSQSHSNGAYFVHLQMDKMTSFTISKNDLMDLKAHIFLTSGSNVGSSNVKSDNSGASNIFANGGKTQELEVGKKYRAKNGDILTIKDFDIENHITIDDGKGKLSSIGIQRISVFKDLINDGELVPLNETGNFVNDVYAKGGSLEDKLTKLENKKSDLESKLFDAKLKEFQVIENMGWGAGMRRSKVSISTAKTDSLKERIKIVEKEIEQIKEEMLPKKPKYILKANIKTVTVKRNGKELIYKGDDVLNGANLFADGGDLTSKANYIPKRDVVSVELKDGNVVNPVNGYWIKKGAEPITSKQRFTYKDLTKNGSEIKITAPKLGNSPEINLVLKYDKENFRYDVYKDGIKKDMIGEKEILNNLNSGIYVFTDKLTPTSKKEMGGETKKISKTSEMLIQANALAKKIRKEGESWNDAKKRAFAQLKNN